MGMGKNSSLCMGGICGFRKWFLLSLVESPNALCFIIKRQIFHCHIATLSVPFFKEVFILF